MPKKLTQEQAIEKAKLTHGDKYDYSLVIYTGIHNKIKIICPVHGIFEQIAKTHIRGNNCKKCALKNNLLSAQASQRFTKERFVEKAIKTHKNKYDYTNIDYTTTKNKIKIKCITHGEFEQTPTNHLRGRGCKQCADDSKKVTKEEFLNRAKEVHGEKYDYSTVSFNSIRDKIDIICYKHGVFKQVISSHLCGRGCPHCNESTGEKAVKRVLEKNHIKYEIQKQFLGLRDARPLRFDFYLPDFNTCIEYDGEQHFKKVKHFGMRSRFEDIQKKDKIKTDFCILNNIKLIRVKYTENPEAILKSSFLFNA